MYFMCRSMQISTKFFVHECAMWFNYLRMSLKKILNKKKYDVIFYNYLDICILNRKDVNHPSTCHGGSLYIYYVESTGID